MARFIATVELSYDEGADPVEIHNLLADALERCRQESMLSDPQNENVACNWLGVIDVEEVSP